MSDLTLAFCSIPLSNAILTILKFLGFTQKLLF